MGNLPVVIIPAICDEKGGPFDAPDDCHNRALSYSFCSLALGGVFVWTYTYQLMRNTSMRYKAFEAAEILKIPNKDLDANAKTRLIKQNDGYIRDTENQIVVDQGPSIITKNMEKSFWHKMMETIGQILAELMSPPTIATFLGFLFGGVKWLRNLIIGHDAPLQVIQDSIQVLGDGTIPCITCLLGGNLTQGTMAQLFDVGTEEFSVILLWTYGAATIALTRSEWAKYADIDIDVIVMVIMYMG
ncbi:putative transporter C5D6.04 [Spatholobus suberectus]|nr:putative transporter C5D6.04 [Spatholobus suberectus]